MIAVVVETFFLSFARPLKIQKEEIPFRDDLLRENYWVSS